MSWDSPEYAEAIMNILREKAHRYDMLVHSMRRIRAQSRANGTPPEATLAALLQLLEAAEDNGEIN